MTWLQRRRKKLLLVLTVGLGMLLWPTALLHAEQTDLTELYTEIRETTAQYIATERELARLQIEIPLEGLPELAEKQKYLKELQNRLAESEVVFRYLDRYGKEMPVRAVDRLSAEERISIRGQSLGRIEALQEAIGSFKEAIRSEEAAYILTLIDERKALANLLAVRRVELLAEYSKFPDCDAADQPCLRQRLRVLCNLKVLVSGAERLPFLRLFAEVDSRLNAPRETETPICENL